MIRRPPRSTLFPSPTLFRLHHTKPAPASAKPAAEATTNARPRRGLALLLRPESIVVQILHDAVLDPHHLLERKAVGVEAAIGAGAVLRIGEQRDAVVHDLSAYWSAAARLRDEGPP